MPNSIKLLYEDKQIEKGIVFPKGWTKAMNILLKEDSNNPFPEIIIVNLQMAGQVGECTSIPFSKSVSIKDDIIRLAVKELKEQMHLWISFDIPYHYDFKVYYGNSE